MAHDTYIRGDQRVDLCLSHEDPCVVVYTRFTLVGDRWTQTVPALRNAPLADEDRARSAMAAVAGVLTDGPNGFVLAITP